VTQRLRAQLLEYFPAAVAGFEDLDAPHTLELPRTAPDPASAAKLTRALSHPPASPVPPRERPPYPARQPRHPHRRPNRRRTDTDTGPTDTARPRTASNKA